jgi:hypothetical protein
VFSAPRPVMHQLPAMWCSAFVLIALLGSGALVRFVTAGEIASLWGWLTGACFISSLALVVGTLSGNSKAFEVLYVLWMYLLTQNIPAVDFAGITPQSPWYIYAPLALALFGVAALARRGQVIAGTGLR